MDTTANLLLEAFRAAGADEGLVYLSVPITSGRREIELLCELNVDRDELHRTYRSRWETEVLAANEEAARLSASRVRELYPHQVVVNPTHLNVEPWTQDQYGDFWDELIRRYAVRVVVSDDWEFSRGARREVALAFSLGLPVVSMHGVPLTDDAVKESDERALRFLLGNGMTVESARAYLTPISVLTRLDRGGVDVAAAENWAVSEVFGWLRGERSYQLRKFGTKLDDQHTRQGLGEDSWWWRQLTTYFHRARVLGVENPGGRQALAKFVATACGLLESTVRLYGELPSPGVPSGYNVGISQKTNRHDT